MYSGNGGVWMRGLQSGSISLVITVSGRTLLALYFTYQQLINASNKAMDALV
jgi:hypothetical protein